MNKTKSCCVNGCKNLNMGADSGVIFYKFPADQDLRKKWTDALLNNDAVAEDWQLANDSVICNVHFVSGQKNENEWHPDYVPSVFRSLRRERQKAKGKHLDEDVEENKPKKPKIGIKRASLSTPNRNSIKNRSALSSGRKGRPKKVVLLKEDSIMQVMNISDDEFLPSGKLNRDSTDDGFKDSTYNNVNLSDKDNAPVLKTLSVVLERTSEKEIKLSTGEITIKEEPFSESDTPLSPSFDGSPLKKLGCKRCKVLEQRMKKMEANFKTAPGVDRCRHCPILQSKVFKMEDELDQLLESRVNKCHRCAAMDQKIRKLENNLKKSQAEVSKLQSRILSVELNDEAFKKYKNKVKMYTGFPNYEALLLVYDHLKPHLPTDTVKFLSPFQMLVIVLMRLKLNFPFWDLTYRFGASPNYIQSFYPQYISALEDQLSHVVLWPKANLRYRLEVLAGNLKQSFAILPKDVSVDTLLKDNDGTLTEEDKIVRVCASLYHISQLVSSNHSQQLIKILNCKDDAERNSLSDKKGAEDSDAKNGSEKGDKADAEQEKPQASEQFNGDESMGDVDDSDIFFEDLTKDFKSGVNSNESLKLECKHLCKEMDALNLKLGSQFKFYSGMRNYEVFNNLLGFLQPHVAHISNDKLSYFNQLLLVLMRLKLNLEVQDVSYIFNVDTDHTVYLTRLWIDVFVKKLSKYIDWPQGVNDNDAEKRLLGTVKLKYQILWSPHCAPRNKITGRQREKFDSHQLVRACGALYNIDDIEVFKHGQKETKLFKIDADYDMATNEELEKQCRDLRTELYEMRKITMSSFIKCYDEENLENNDQMVQYYTGFPTYDMLRKVFNYVVPAEKTETRKGISPFQQFILVLIRLKLNVSTQDVSYRFGLGHSNAHKFIQDWILLLHSRLGPHITWPDDDEDVEQFTDMLRKTYSFIKTNMTPKCKDNWRKFDTGIYDIATLVCAGLYNIGEVSFSAISDSEFDSFDDEW